MDSSKQTVIAMLASLAQGQQQLIETAHALVVGKPTPAHELPAPAETGITTREVTREVTHQPNPDPKAPSPENDELAEQIMTELERAEAKGMTPRDLGKKVIALVPGKPSVPPHQRYRFRVVMQHLTSEQRIVRQNADDPKKLRYVTASFAVETQ